jgi:ParB family chromosome partitioning protein
MARKHLLANVSASLQSNESGNTASGARSEYARRGASRSMMQSLDEMAENSMRMLEGDTIVSLDPSLLDGSFVADRIDESPEDFQALLEAIRAAGQSSPILVRPHPDEPGRYMIVYGHRRARAARELGIAVRAVVKPIEDIAHVIAQGQENTARASLTFIEKALFARKLLNSGMTKETAKMALTVDDTLLSRMLAVVEVVPEPVLDAVGSAKGVGRDRWEAAKKLLLAPARTELALEIVRSEDFQHLGSDARFSTLLDQLKKGKTPKQPAAKAVDRNWTIANHTVTASSKLSGKSFTLALKSKDAAQFGGYLSERLERLYEEFRQSDMPETGN